MLTLQNFEEHIDEMILARGEEYAYDGSIQTLKESDPGEYIAQVNGTSPYRVRVVLDEDDVLEYSCTCPYNKGPICKHVVAVLYLLADDERDIDAGAAGSRGTTPADLAELSKEELIAIVQGAQGVHADVRRRVAMAHASDSEFEKKPYVRRVIRDAIDDAADRHGSIWYGRTLDAVQGALEVLEVAETLERTNTRAAMVVYQTVFEEMARLVERADDSDGDIGGALADALERLHKLALMVRETKDEPLRRELFKYVCTEWSNKKYEGWDWPWDLLRIGAELVTDEKEEKQFVTQLARATGEDECRVEAGAHADGVGDAVAMPRTWGQGSDWLKQHRRESAAGIRLKLIERLRPTEVEAFLLDHVELYNMREEAIKHFLASKDMARARTLAAEGVAHSKKDKLPGLTAAFTNYLMQCAEQVGDKDEAGRYAIELFLESHRDPFTHYRTAKKHLAKRWNTELRNIIDTLKNDRKTSYGGDLYKLCDVYVEEHMWDDLLAIVTEHPRLVTSYGNRLEKRFPREIGRVYITLAGEGMESAGGRGIYQEKCALLSKAKQLGCITEVGAVLNEWRVKYERRRALMEEIAKV